MQFYLENFNGLTVDVLLFYIKQKRFSVQNSMIWITSRKLSSCGYGSRYPAWKTFLQYCTMLLIWKYHKILDHSKLEYGQDNNMEDVDKDDIDLDDMGQIPSDEEYGMSTSDSDVDDDSDSDNSSDEHLEEMKQAEYVPFKRSVYFRLYQVQWAC